MHGRDDRPRNLAASSLESPSTTTLSLPTRRGTLNPSLLIEFAISRTCAGSLLRSFRTCDFRASMGQGSIRSEGRMSLRPERQPAFSAAACLTAALRRERPFAFNASRKLSRRRSSSAITLDPKCRLLVRMVLAQERARIIAAPRALHFSQRLARESRDIFSVLGTLASACGWLD